MSANVSLVAANVTQIKSGRTRNVGASVKIQNNIMCAKKFIFEILIHIAVEMVNM